MEELADSLPKTPVISASVLPFFAECSETSLQAYNAVFSMAWMRDFCAGSVGYMWNVFAEGFLYLVWSDPEKGTNKTVDIGTNPNDNYVTEQDLAIEGVQHVVAGQLV